MSKSSDEPFRRVEVITSVQRRQRWSVTEEMRLAEEALQTRMSASYVAGQAGILPSQLWLQAPHAWRRSCGPASLRRRVGASQVRGGLEKRVRDLERMLGKKTVEAEILKKALDLACKKDLALAVVK